jgi:alpha-L-fucosidase 2
MLLQSQNNEINFLPALPDRWSSGSFRGLRARGGFIIDSVSWANKTLSKAIVSSLAGNTCNVRHKTATKSFPTEAGMTYVLDASLNVIESYKSGQTSVSGSIGSQKATSLQYNILKPSVTVATVSRSIRVKITGKVSDVTVQVFNLSGRAVASIDKNVTINNSILFPDMHSGTYIVKVYGAGLLHTQKITLQ